MSILGSIFSKIFPSSHANAATAPNPAGASATGPAGTTAASGAAGAGSAGSSSSANAAPSMPAAAARPISEVDVEAMLNEMNTKSGQKLNWRTSIVDLMKLLGLDSSLTARKELARELSYTGDTNDSATMNVWLHKQVMKRVADNGGKVPAELRG